MQLSKIIAIVAAPLVLAACATTSAGPVDVTRFHRADQVALTPGAFTVETTGSFGGANLEDKVWSDAVAGELTRLGFRADSGNAPYIVKVSHNRGMVDPALGGRRSPVSVGVGGSTGSYGSGLGVGIGIDLSGPPKPRVGDDLAVSITRRADNQVVWEGRASSESKQGSAASQPNVAAAKMAAALFKDFPGKNGASIRVP